MHFVWPISNCEVICNVNWTFYATHFESPGELQRELWGELQSKLWGNCKVNLKVNHKVNHKWMIQLMIHIICTIYLKIQFGIQDEFYKMHNSHSISKWVTQNVQFKMSHIKCVIHLMTHFANQNELQKMHGTSCNSHKCMICLVIQEHNEWDECFIVMFLSNSVSARVTNLDITEEKNI